MDIGTIGGIIGGLLLLTGSIVVGGGDLFLFMNIPSFLTTFGGTLAGLFVSYPMRKIVQSWDIGKRALYRQDLDPGGIINMLVTLSEKARREGLLALEDDIEEVDDPFLKKGVQLVVDGTDPELVKRIMRTDLEKLEYRHGIGRGLYEMAGLLSPAFGMIGTLMGLIIMLANLTDKSSIGKGMSLALITTLYGAILANLVFIPMSKKLEGRSNEEILLKEIMLEGTLSIQSGDNPRVVKDKLTSFLSPEIRESISIDAINN